jgi:GNAT superfamily N-acetyltransferase
VELAPSASIELRFAGPENLVRIGDFLLELGGPYFNEKRFPGKTAKDYYAWKYFGNRVAQAVVGIAMAGDRVVSTVAAMIKPLQVGKRQLIAYELGDFLTAADFRRRGLFSQLVEMVCAETAVRGASFVYVQPNDTSFPLLTKLRFTEPVQIHQRHYPIPTRLMAHRLHVPPGLISWTCIDDLTRRLAAPLGSGRSVHVERVYRFDGDTDRIWQKAGEEYAFLVARESEFLNWRYADSPTPFQIWLARREGEPVGFLVGFAAVEDGLGEIVDLFTSSNDRPAAQALLNHAFREFHGQGMRAIFAYTIARAPLSMVGEMLRRACPLVRRAPLHFVVRGFDSAVASQLPTFGWHLAPGDFDGV